MSEININLILSILALGGALFAIFKAVKDPDARNEKTVAVLKEQLNTERMVTAETVKTMQNCLHTVESKIDIITSNLGSQAILIGKLETIINERVPKKEK
jgi:hypothetical protein